MTIKTITEENQITLQLDGWLDTMAAPELGEAIEQIETASAIILDFDKVEYIASSGLRQVVACHRKAKELGASFSIIHVGTEIMGVFELTGLDKKLTIEAK